MQHPALLPIAAWHCCRAAADVTATIVLLYKSCSVGIGSGSCKYRHLPARHMYADFQHNGAPEPTRMSQSFSVQKLALLQKKV